jgi:hypothetical protein
VGATAVAVAIVVAVAVMAVVAATAGKTNPTAVTARKLHSGVGFCAALGRGKPLLMRGSLGAIAFRG